MDINNLQRTLPQSYHVDAGRIRERLQQADKGIAAGKRQGDSVDISGEGRRALREKMSAAKRMEHSGDIGKLSPINSGRTGAGRKPGINGLTGEPCSQGSSGNT